MQPNPTFRCPAFLSRNPSQVLFRLHKSNCGGFEEFHQKHPILKRTVWSVVSNRRVTSEFKVSDRVWPCHEFEPSTTKDAPFRAAMHVKSVEN
ncbi:hypothetical protein TNCV_1202291 [Trichonephila clavipes]|nr:hypothetical protein TNCV_1202291 [Trichonephila clavipes]